MAWTKWRMGSRGKVMQQPGHWLLLGQAVMIAISLAVVDHHGVGDCSELEHGVVLVGILRYELSAQRSDLHRCHRLHAKSPLDGGSSGSCCLIACCIAWPTSSSPCSNPYGLRAYSLLFGACRLCDLFVLVWLLVLALSDLRRARRRDWLHWVGVGSYLLSVCTSMLWTLWMRFFPIGG